MWGYGCQTAKLRQGVVQGVPHDLLEIPEGAVAVE
jgi:hypothetical protein